MPPPGKPGASPPSTTTIEVRSTSGAPRFVAEINRTCWEVDINMGDTVEIVGLASRSELNGCHGTVLIDVDEPPERVAVQVACDGSPPQQIQVRPANLILRKFRQDRSEVNFVGPSGNLEIKTMGWCHLNGHGEHVAPQTFAGNWWHVFSEERRTQIVEQAAGVTKRGSLRTHEQRCYPWVRGYEAAVPGSTATDDGSDLFDRAVSLAEEGRLDECLLLFRRLVETEPKEPSHYVNVAGILDQQGRQLAAVKTTLRAMEVLGELAGSMRLGPVAQLHDDPMWLGMLADAFLSITGLRVTVAGDWWSRSLPDWFNDASLKELSAKAVSVLPASANVWQMRGMVLARRPPVNEWPPAQSRLPDRSPVQPGPPHPRSAAELLEAAAAFERAHELEPSVYVSATKNADKCRAEAAGAGDS